MITRAVRIRANGSHGKRVQWAHSSRRTDAEHWYAQVRLGGVRCAKLMVVCVAACGNRTDAITDEPRPVYALESVTPWGVDSVLHDVRGITASADALFVLSSIEPFVHVYSHGGKLRSTSGMSGEGPEEFGNPWSIMADHGGSTARIWDPARRRLTTVDSLGKPLSSHSVRAPRSTVRGDIRQVSYGTPQRMERWRNMIVLQNDAGGVRHTSDFWSSRLLALDSLGRVVDTIADFRAMLAEDGELGTADIFVPIPLWAVCAGRELAVFDPVAMSVQWYDRIDSKSWRRDVSIETRRVSPEDVRRYVRHTVALELRDAVLAPAEMDRLVSQIAATRGDAFAHSTPPAVDMLCDAELRVWLNLFATDHNGLGYSSDWLIIGQHDNTLTVRFPANFRPLRVTQRGVYGVIEDHLEVQRIGFVPFDSTFPTAGTD